MAWRQLATCKAIISGPHASLTGMTALHHAQPAWHGVSFGAVPCSRRSNDKPGWALPWLQRHFIRLCHYSRFSSTKGGWTWGRLGRVPALAALHCDGRPIPILCSHSEVKRLYLEVSQVRLQLQQLPARLHCKQPGKAGSRVSQLQSRDACRVSELSDARPQTWRSAR